MKQILAILSVLFLIACSAPVVEKTSGVLESADKIISINNFKFSPQSATVALGETVIWKNEDQTSHTVIVDGAESPELFTGDTWSHKFESAGTFEYSCGIHGSMSGVVIVE